MVVFTASCPAVNQAEGMLAADPTVRGPRMSERGAKSGMNAVEVVRKVVESQGAALEVEKKDVITGWIEAIRVESEEATYTVWSLCQRQRD